VRGHREAERVGHVTKTHFDVHSGKIGGVETKHVADHRVGAGEADFDCFRVMSERVLRLNRRREQDRDDENREHPHGPFQE
jgi:hypothetical protein